MAQRKSKAIVQRDIKEIVEAASRSSAPHKEATPHTHQIELGTMRPSFRPPDVKGNHIIQIFWNADLRCNHVGLGKIAKEFGDVDIADLVPGEMCIFVNVAMNKMKVISGISEKNGLGLMSYYQTPTGRRIDVQAIDYIPESFSARRGVNYDEALKKSLLDRLSRKTPPRRTGATLEPRHFENGISAHPAA